MRTYLKKANSSSTVRCVQCNSSRNMETTVWRSHCHCIKVRSEYCNGNLSEASQWCLPNCHLLVFCSVVWRS